MSGFFQRLFGKDNKPAIARGPLDFISIVALRSTR
ncbi:conserved protein, DUF2491 family [Escherichia coli]|nr:conserved protein, DUF2491 family [Escherichia coli]